MGVSPTAIYRYFDDKGTLVVAMREDLLARALPSDAHHDDPTDAIVTSALNFRRIARDHPCLSQIMGAAAVEGPHSTAAPRATVGALRALGLCGPDLVRAYRQLESFVVGSCMFDFSGAPRHLQDRYERLRRIDDPEFVEQLGTPADIERVNEEAYEASLRTLVGSFVSCVQEDAAS